MVDPSIGQVGSKVGGGRWPMAAAHPEAWQKPWAGVVLAQDDPRAWEGTIAFSARPTRKAVQAHLRSLAAAGQAIQKVPVLWDFGARTDVRWENLASLAPVAVDLARWESLRSAAMAVEMSKANARVRSDAPHLEAMAA